MNPIFVGERARQKKRYQPDLDDLLSQCELNYWLLKRLIPEVDELEVSRCVDDKSAPRWQFETKNLIIELTVTALARYTTTMKMTVETPNIKMARYVKLIIRLYHDAKMMEVMEGTGPSTLKAVYEHPNSGMKAPDEKQQINRFVGECIKACNPTTRTQAITVER